MSIISLIENNCKHCHRCVAHCPTHAISFINKKPEIISDQCILCGECYVVCPQHAKSVSSDIELVLSWLKQGLKVHASLAPSFIALLKTEKECKEAILEMGFSSVSETSIAAAKISDHYRKLSQDKSKNIITTCCPVVVSYIEKNFPNLVDQLAPVKSPMRAHGQMIKQEYPDDKVVFVGPCIAKIKEAHESNEVDAVITFEDILEYTKTQQNDVNYYSSSYTNDKARQYPTSGGILSTLIGLESDVDMMVVDGMQHVKDCCLAIEEHQISGVFIEMSACVGSCLNGPLLSKNASKKWKAKHIIESNNKHKEWYDQIPLNNLQTKYTAKKKSHKAFSDQEIEQVLQSLGKFTKEDQLNCQTCGYATCIEKAIAVLEKKADPQLCLPYALSKAQSMSNIIIQHTPNAIVVLDEKFDVIEINPAASRVLKTTNPFVLNTSIFSWLKSEKLKETLVNLHDVDYFIDEYADLNRVFDHACIPIKESSHIVLILMDLTQKIEKEKMIQDYRNQVLSVTQKIIDEQMITIQEIAGLLGETSANSKIALERLKNTLKDTNL